MEECVLEISNSQHFMHKELVRLLKTKLELIAVKLFGIYVILVEVIKFIVSKKYSSNHKLTKNTNTIVLVVDTQTMCRKWVIVINKHYYKEF